MGASTAGRRGAGLCAIGGCALGMWLVGADSVHGQTVATLLLRSHRYLAEYQRTFSGVVSKETYHQEIRRGERVRRRRGLSSDVLMVWVPSDSSWLLFRDVYEVNGRPVHDRQRRLERLFIESPATALDQAEQIAEESARFNIGDVSRNVNLPTMALAFLYPANMPRSRFHKAGEETVAGVPTWAIQFVEHTRPTMIRAGEGDLFSRGTFWIDPVDGRVVRSQLRVGDTNTDVRATITVTYGPNTKLGFWVPAEMVEEYTKKRGHPDEKIHGTATYTDFRTFQVQVEESIAPPVDEKDRKDVRRSEPQQTGELQGDTPVLQEREPGSRRVTTIAVHEEDVAPGLVFPPESEVAGQRVRTRRVLNERADEHPR